MKIEKRILLSRLMTRSGDQAWDFAIPIALIEMFPSNMRIAFVYFFSVKLGTIICMPFIGKLIDLLPRKKMIQLGIGFQVFSVILSAIIIFLISTSSDKNLSLSLTTFFGSISLIILGILSSVGSSTMDISVANDLVPSTVTKEKLPHFNSRLRQLDLMTEVTSPVLAGLLLIIHLPGLHLMGFYLIAIWNLVSFYPEYILLNGILKKEPSLNIKKIVPSSVKLSLYRKMRLGWNNFTRQPVCLVIISSALLWLSVLSPHGVLLTAFLKGGWSIPEPLIGTFRALGALFGLAATLIFPLIHRRIGLVKAGRLFISFQVIMILFSLMAFQFDSRFTQFFFLFFILLSRIGLYGFGLSETEIRQISIPEQLRGEINGVATSLTGLATLIIFAVGIIFSRPENFGYLVLISVFAVSVAAILFNMHAVKNLSKIERS